MGDSTRNFERLHTNEMELGTTDAIRKHYARRVVPPPPVSQRRLQFENSRPRWLRECLAEATGVFFYVFPGIASVAATTINGFDSAFGSLYQVGMAFGVGIVCAIITCAPISGGHFNPAITISFAVWQGFPWRKVPGYILSQILGAFMAGLLLVGMYHQQLQMLAAGFREKGASLISSQGPPGVLCSFPAPTQSLGYLFMIEWFVNMYLGIVIWACLDPANPFITPAVAPFIIGLSYAAMVWGFADVTVSLNGARDLGTRIVAAIFYGPEVFTFNHYSWISILVNIPSVLLATGYYEFLMRDSLERIGKGAVKFDGEEQDLALHLTKTGISLVDEEREAERERQRSGVVGSTSKASVDEDGKLRVPPV